MQDSLLLVLGLAAPLISASVMITAELNSPTTTVTKDGSNFTTFITLTSAAPAAIQPVDYPNITRTAEVDAPTLNVEVDSSASTTPSAEETATESSTFNPIPASLPTLSSTSNYEPPTPTPGSIAILNGIPTRILNKTIPQHEILLERAPADPAPFPANTTIPKYDPYQMWDVDYRGPIHEADWEKYLQIWDPVWWSHNLDSIRQTACMCSAPDFLTNPDAQLASYARFDYYSHQYSTVYRLDWLCGPSNSSMDLSHRVTSGKHLDEFCWQGASGEYAGDHRIKHDIEGYYCDAKTLFCVKPWRAEKRELIFHRHRRYYDRNGVHSWSEVQPVVRDVCEPICRDKFKMDYNDYGMHNPNFITTWYPAKPIVDPHRFHFDGIPPE